MTLSERELSVGYQLVEVNTQLLVLRAQDVKCKYNKIIMPYIRWDKNRRGMTGSSN